jgi:hypothetical protein
MLSRVTEGGSKKVPTDLLKQGATQVSDWSMKGHLKMTGWLRQNGGWVLTFTIGLIIIIAFVFFYEWIWRNTTDEPWTSIMRRKPYLLIVPSVAALSTTTYFAQATSDDVLPTESSLRPKLRQAVIFRLLVVWLLTMLVGVLVGHVFW